MAPEVLESSLYSEAGDVYSFGIILWQLLTRQQPFPKLRLKEEVKRAVLAGDRPPIPSNCPPLLKELIENCWKKNPKDRPTFKSGLFYIFPLF
jgi:serine/threonine protein kinase